MKADDNKIIFNKNDHNGEKFVSKTSFTLKFSEKGFWLFEVLVV